MVKNILKDGSVKDDLKGHVVKYKDAPTIYAIINGLNKGEVHEQRGTTRKTG